MNPFNPENGIFNMSERREASAEAMAKMREIDALGHRVVAALEYRAILRQLQRKVMKAEDRMVQLHTRLTLAKKQQNKTPAQPRAAKRPLRRGGFGRVVDVLRRPFSGPDWEAAAAVTDEPKPEKSERSIEWEYATATEEVKIYREQLARWEQAWGDRHFGAAQGIARAIEGHVDPPTPYGIDAQAPKLAKVEGPFQ